MKIIEVIKTAPSKPPVSVIGGADASFESPGKLPVTTTEMMANTIKPIPKEISAACIGSPSCLPNAEFATP